MLPVRTPTHVAIRPIAASLSLVVAWAAGGSASADSLVNFWLSNADVGPTVPVIYALPGSVAELDVWARPAVGYRLSAFSLDVQAATPGVANFTEIRVLNPELQANPPLFRHQLVFDSESGLFVTDNEIYGFLGFSFYDGAMGLPDGAGIGPICGIDPECGSASGAPSWRIATITYQAGMALGSTELFLAIGEQGLAQSPAAASEPDPPADASAVFGLPNDAINQWATLLGTDHRHDPQGLADAVIQVASADFEPDGDVDGMDFLSWQRGLGVGTKPSDGDANGDGQVTAIDLAVWRFQFGATGVVLPASSLVPEPTGVCSLAVLAAVSIHRQRWRTITRPI